MFLKLDAFALIKNKKTLNYQLFLRLLLNFAIDLKSILAT